MKLVASCAFGLEAIVARELGALGYETTTSGPGQVEFEGDWQAIAKANLWLRCADRVAIVVMDFACQDFDVLFETAKEVAWAKLISPEGAIHVTGSSLKSKLSSVPAIQRTIKKAIVEQLLSQAHVSELPENGPLYRVHIGLRNDQARLVLDTTGASLHKRGYRQIATRAPLKETLAAALVQLSFWNPERPLIDPFCGGGTILIEAAMIGRNLAPGLNRSFSSDHWSQFPQEIWQAERRSARQAMKPELPMRLLGCDIHDGALSLARKNATSAAVIDDVHFQNKPFQDLSSKREYGCIVTNPPYGDRLEPENLRRLYESMPLVLQNLPTWSHFILTAYPKFERQIGRQADRRRKLYNGRIECTYYQFHGPRPASGAEQPAAPAVFGAATAKEAEQAEIFASRLRKRARHLRRWPTRRGITCYRVYERDVPEIPLVVDRYENHVHVVEFERPHCRDLAQHARWLERMCDTIANTLDVPRNHVHLKSRTRQSGRHQHEKVNQIGDELVVHEAGLRFLVNLTDYTDTGLFLDHRTARGMVRVWSNGKRVLNLFAYTGAFSVYAAAGGATAVTTVDWSSTYLNWAQRNLELNGFQGDPYRFLASDVRSFVDQLGTGDQFDIIVCDPPTFSNSKRSEHVWDVQKDHGKLLRDLLPHLSSHGTIFFSSNFRRLRFDASELPPSTRVQEISKRTVPEDFRNQRIHRSWLVRHAGE